MSFRTSFGPVKGYNTLAGNHFTGATTINFGEIKQTSQNPPVCRAIHFPRNEGFIPRPAIHDQIQALLPPKTEYQSAALWGLGGSGKTQTALEYTYSRCCDPACTVFWVHADTETSFTQDYKWIAKQLGLAYQLDGQELLEAVRRHIERLPQWVLILDNADDLTLFGVGRTHSVSEGAPDLSLYVPRGPIGTVLWTSRDQRITGSFVGPQRGINISSMSSNEAEMLLKSVTVLEKPEDDPNTVAQLLAELDWLPLAISQATVYMRRTKLSATEYLKKIKERKNRWKMLKKSEYDRHRRPQASNSVLETWHISMEYLQQDTKISYDILTVLAYVDSQNIPFELIFQYCSHSN